jgi:hypothetical protein
MALQLPESCGNRKAFAWRFGTRHLKQIYWTVYLLWILEVLTLKATVVRDFLPLFFFRNRPHIVPEFTT